MPFSSRARRIFIRSQAYDRDMSQLPATLDRTDRRILALLQRDGRITNLKLAQAVHLSPTASTLR